MKKNILPNIVIITLCVLVISMLLICNFSIAFSIENIQNVETEKIIQQADEVGSGSTENNGLTSTSYIISDLYEYITAIPPKTTISEFKKGFNIEESKVHLYRNSTLKEEITERICKNKYGN